MTVLDMNTATRHALKARDQAHLDPETRARVEQAVLDVFADREFHRVGLIEIARAANVSLQTIYKYYGSKEALLFSSLDSWLGKLSHRMIDHLQGIEDYKEKLRKVFWVVLDFFEKNPKVAQLIMSSVYINTWRKTEAYQNRPLFGAFMGVLGEGRARGVLNDQVDEKILLDYILGVLGRLVQMYIHRGQKKPLTAQANVLFEMLCGPSPNLANHLRLEPARAEQFRLANPRFAQQLFHELRRRRQLFPHHRQEHAAPVRRFELQPVHALTQPRIQLDQRGEGQGLQRRQHVDLERNPVQLLALERRKARIAEGRGPGVVEQLIDQPG